MRSEAKYLVQQQRLRFTQHIKINVIRTKLTLAPPFTYPQRKTMSTFLLLLLQSTVVSTSPTVAETAALVEKLRAEYVWPSGEEAAGGVDEDQFCTVNELALVVIYFRNRHKYAS